jgi:hypothetical protein
MHRIEHVGSAAVVHSIAAVRGRVSGANCEESIARCGEADAKQREQGRAHDHRIDVDVEV